VLKLFSAKEIQTRNLVSTKRMQMHLYDVMHLQRQLVLTTANLAPCVYLQEFSKQVPSWSYGVSTGLVHVKTIAVFITNLQHLAETLLSNTRRGKRLCYE